MIKSPNRRYIAVTRWTEKTVTDMLTSISDKQFICHFWEVKKNYGSLLYLSGIKENDILLHNDPKRKNLSKRWNNS